MRVALACCLAALLVLSVYYFFFVQRKYNYLTGRNFRFLAAIGGQLESSLQSRGKLLESLAQEQDLASSLRNEAKKSTLIKDFAPGYEDVRVAPTSPDAAPGQPVFVLTGSGSRIEVDYTAPGVGGENPGISLQGSMKLRTVAEPLFQSRKAFEALLLANNEGTVVYHQGVDDLSVTRLDQLVEKSLRRRTGSTVNKGEAGRLLASSSESYDVELNGRDYRLFVEPIPLSLQEPRIPGERKVWLVCGLVPRKEFVYKSLAVSSALLSSLLALVVLTALSWPFLKLFLISKMQRVSLFDVLLLGLCGLLGVAIATLYLLDWAAFHRLESTSRQQLEALARRMEKNIRHEILAAYPVMIGMEKELAPAVARGEIQGKQPELLRTNRTARQLVFQNYPFAQTFVLIGGDGKQIYKASVNEHTSPLIPVRDRGYFKRAAESNVWDLRALEDVTDPRKSARTNLGPALFYIEPIIGWTNHEHMAMLSKPVPWRAIPAAAGAPVPRVSALGIPMVSLVRPTLPPGVKFAVIDNETEDGRVLFHSDLERVQTENFLIEVDQDRHLRSAVFARRAETIPIRYWGEDYFARTTPVRGLPWTIVVLQDMSILRAVNVDWISTTLVMILLYAGFLALVLVIIASARPSYRADWVWPDPQRHWDYRILSRAYVALLTGFLLAVWGLRSSPALIELAYTLPALAIVLAYLKLHRRASGRIFALAAGSLLLLTCAVLLFEGDAPLEMGVPGWLPWAILLLISVAFLTAAGLFPEGRRKVVPPPVAVEPPVAILEEAPAQQPAAPAPPPRAARLTWPSVITSYCLAGTFLLFLTAVLPAAGFFKVAQKLHMVSFLRHGQLTLSLELKDRAVRARQTAMKVAGPDGTCLLQERLAVDAAGPTRGCAPPPNVAGLDNYAAAFYQTQVQFPPAGRHNPKECLTDADLAILPDSIEDLLPRYSEPAAQMRELLHSSASDCIWFWERPSASFSDHKFHSRDYPEREIQLSSSISAPEPQEESPAERRIVLSSLGGAFSPAGLLQPLCLLGLVGLVWLLVRFVARRIFLIDLLEPLWSEKEETGPATIGRNLFLVGRGHQWQEEVKKNRFDWLHMRDLENPGEDWCARKAALLESDRVILVEGFEYKFRDPELNQKKLLLLEELAGMQDRTVVVSSKISPALLFSRENRAGGIGGNGAADPNALLVQRWRNLLGMFTVCEDDLQSILERVKASSKIQSEVLRTECGVNPHLLSIAEELDKDVRHLSREQILEEFGERAEGYYQGLWASCSSEEEVVLEHLAEEGLVNEKSRRIIRRLMARGFVRRDPHFRLMNETFRRFVASSTCKGEVLALEKEASPSPWDRLRWPLLAGLAASFAFFLATQQDLMDGMLASVTGVTAGLPAIVKLFDFFGNRPDLSRLKDVK